MASPAADLEVELELHYELEVDDESRPVAVPYDSELLVDIELVDDDLADPWFLHDDGASLDGAYELDPVHPLRKLGSWVRAGFRAA